MARTKAEVRAFLDSKVGTIVPHPAPYQDLGGQCVTLIKALMEFLGVPNPYAARGNAIDVDDTLLRQGIADNGKGWLTIVVNRDMGFIGGVHYGHIWVDLQNEANYESNGSRALYTTKNTRPLSQGQQFVNLDKYINDNAGGDMITKDDVGPVRVIMSEVEGWDMGAIHNGSLDPTIMGAWQGHSWVEFIMHCWTVNPNHRGYLVQQIAELNNKVAQLSSRPTADQLQAVKDASVALQKAAEESAKAAAESKAKYDQIAAEREADTQTGNSFLRWLGDQLNKLLGKG